MFNKNVKHVKCLLYLILPFLMPLNKIQYQRFICLMQPFYKRRYSIKFSIHCVVLEQRDSTQKIEYSCSCWRKALHIMMLPPQCRAVGLLHFSSSRKYPFTLTTIKEILSNELPSYCHIVTGSCHTLATHAHCSSFAPLLWLYIHLLSRSAIHKVSVRTPLEVTYW